MDGCSIDRLPRVLPNQCSYPLIPLFKAGQISHKNVVINSYGGVSGAGKTLKEDLLFTKVNENLKAYGLPKHRHLSEISEQLDTAAFEDVSIQFCPHLAPIDRGIHTTIVVPAMFLLRRSTLNGKSVQRCLS